MKNAEITLTRPELYIGAMVGVMRRVASQQNGNDKNKHARKSDWATDADGALAEMAASKYLGIYWVPQVNTFKAPDLSNGMQSRSTNHRDGHLIVRANDSDLQTFILVISCDAPTFRLVGIMRGFEAKADEYIHHGREFGEADCWWVPQDKLDDLPPGGGIK